MGSSTETMTERVSSSNKGERAADSAKPVGPLYVQVSNTLKDEIVNGVHPVGSTLPTEDALCERFSVSRYTVREALRLLRDGGLVASRQGAGTVVIPPSSSSSDIHQVMSINDLVDFATGTRFVIESTKMISIDARLASRTNLPVDSHWLEVRGYRQSEAMDTPVCWTEYYINRAYAAVGRLLQRHTGPIFPLIEDLFGVNVAEVHQQISATLLEPELARALDVEANSAALEVRRIYKAAGAEIAQVTINTHPASRFQHSMTMRRVRV
ncbi:GntR family transcriptional regulator [Pseudomaricurvus hydrocarbonicus]|nr:GntR family transcriptional regulator [Aestuariicella hydrocarbonica]